VVIRLPLAYPLRNVEVECMRSLGISADKWKRWQLQIVTLLSMRDGSVVDAVSLWIRNLEKEFEGLEPCPICYRYGGCVVISVRLDGLSPETEVVSSHACSILHPKNFSLPSKECRTCHNRFHTACILKW
jgi:E3 ubiquitin-protein ligase listerin